MAIGALTMREFNRFRSARWTLIRLTDQAVEWSTDNAGAVLGAIVCQQFQLDWSFIIAWARDSVGKCREIARDTGLPELSEVRRCFVEKIAMAKPIRDQGPSPHEPTAA
jgi:hypothetical protein